MCDKDDFGGKTCPDYTSHVHGELICTTDCKLDVSRCHTCGNGLIEGPEECDGENLGGASCESLGALEGGDLSCRTDCTFDKSDCLGICGNGILEDGEECDGSNLGGMDCVDLGYTLGELSCSADCTFDVSGCERTPECGNGVIDEGEACDGGDLGGETCETLGIPGGSLACLPDCSGFDTSGCGAYCGNGVVDEGEVCDGDNFAGETCETLGFDGGALACGADCKSFITSGCFTCANGVCEAEKGETAAGCPEDCGWEQISVGYMHTCAVKVDGSAWCWGSNYKGALGVGTSDGVWLQPVRVSGMDSGVRQIAAGHFCTCAVKTNGSVWCWGNNTAGQLGIGTSSNQENSPVQVVDLTDIAQVDVARYHGCARSVGGTLWCWGSGDSGRLGVDSLTNHSSPVEVAAFSNVTQVSAGDSHTCAIKSDGTAWCWGDNNDGKLGIGMTTGPETCGSKPCSKTPVQISGINGVTSITADFLHTCAANASGVWCWGYNAYSQLGDNTSMDRSSPVSVQNLGGASALGLGTVHTCALDLGGHVWCWGAGDTGQIGEGGPIDQSLVQKTPSQVTGLSDVVDLAAYGSANCAIDSMAQAWCWGYNGNGVLGDGTTDNRNYPVQVLEPY